MQVKGGQLPGAPCRTDLSLFHGVLFPNLFPNLALVDRSVADRFLFEHKLRILFSVSGRHCPRPLAAGLRGGAVAVKARPGADRVAVWP